MRDKTCFVSSQFRKVLIDHFFSFCLASVGASVDGDDCIEELAERIDPGVVLVAVVRFPGVGGLVGGHMRWRQTKC